MYETTATENIFTLIGNNYYHFTATEKKVADYVLSNRTGVQYMSISELADECGVAEATISRFCRRLSLRGYSAFKLALAKAVVTEQGDAQPEGAGEAEITAQDSVTELGRKLCVLETAAITQGLELIRAEQITKAVDLLWNAKRVICIGQGGSMIMAMEAAHLFSTVSTQFMAVQDSHIQSSTVALLAPGDVLLFFSYSGSTKNIVELMELAHSRGASIILITRFSRSPGAAKSDVVLQCGANEGPLQLGSVPARMAQLFLVDLLYHEFIRRDPEGAAEKQERIAEALTEKHL